MRSQPNARNTMLSVGNTIEAGGREVDLPGCRSEDQMFPRLSSTGSRSACPRRRLCKTPAIKVKINPGFASSAHLTPISLFQVSVKSKRGDFRRLDGSQQDVPSGLLALAVRGRARVLLAVLLRHVLNQEF